MEGDPSQGREDIICHGVSWRRVANGIGGEVADWRTKPGAFALKTVRWILLFVALAAGLAACGRKSDLEHPPESEATFPKTYPAR